MYNGNDAIANMRPLRCRYKYLLFLHIVVFIQVYLSPIDQCSVLINIKSRTNPIIPYHHVLLGQRYLNNVRFVSRLLWFGCIITSITWLYILLYIAGDIHPNPGPYTSSVNDNSSSSSPSSTLLSSSSTSPVSSMLNVTDLSRYLSVVHYNVQSIIHKIDVLGSELLNFDILTFSETWLNNSVNDSEVIIDSFSHPERKDRASDNHGGVLVYVKEGLPYKRRIDLEINKLECIWIELILNRKHVLLGVFYRPPNSDALYNRLIEDSIHLAADTNIGNIIVTGDLNYNMLTPTSARKIESICQQLSLSQIIEDATHFTEHSSSLLDLFLVSDKDNVIFSGVGDPFLNQDVRYHCPVFAYFKFWKPKRRSFTRKIWKYSHGDYDKLRSDIRQTDFSTLKHENINTYSQNISNYLLQLSNSCIPNYNITVRPSEPPWLSTELKRSIRARKRAYKRAKTSQSAYHWAKFRELRNKATAILRKSKENYYKNLSLRLRDNSLTSKDWWKVLKHFISTSNCQNSIPALISDNEYIYDDYNKANLLNTFFQQQTKLNDTNIEPPNTPNITNETLQSIVITPLEVETILKSLPLGKASGPDEINNRVLREAANELSILLCDLFNYSLTKSQVPDKWKEANVCAIFKKGDKSLVSNYRPISLLSNIEKVFERIIFKHVYNFIHENSILTHRQSGFRPQDSTVNQLAFLYNSYCEALDAGKEIRVVFFDVSKAFDRVWHKGLLEKLKSIGIDGALLSWFSSYLSNRRQRVIIPGTFSDWTTIEAGVPQGSILGPLLFLLYINDIVTEIQSDIRLFADDTSLSIIVEHPDTANQALTSDIRKIQNWADKWLVTFNPSKSESMTITRKINKPYHPPLNMYNQQIVEVPYHKHLGVCLSNDCSWHNHINYVKNKAWAKIYVLRKLKYMLDRKSLEIAYFTFIRPVLEYADVIWDNCTVNDKNELDKIQNEAGRIVTGATKLVSIHDLYSETGWETLSARRCKHKLILFYKMMNGQTPDYLSCLTPPTIAELSDYNLRNRDDISTIHSRTSLYYNSFLPSTIREWNSLPLSLRQAPTLTCFKRKLNDNISLPPQYYFSGSRQSQILHCRLRTNCSSLNQHLHKKNIVDSPRCLCGSVESTYHYFFKCNMYTNIRVTLFNSIRPLCSDITNHLLLHGKQTLSLDNNVLLFKHVQKFIIDSKRFS